MRTAESFPRPGQQLPADELAALPPTPRPIHGVGIRTSVLLRLLLWLLDYAVGGYIVYACILDYIRTASFLAWFIVIAFTPVFLIAVPWYLVSTFRARMRTFHHYHDIYRNGLPAVGTVNTLTRISGHDMDCHNIEYSRRTARSKIRVDYTFLVDNTVRTGTVLLRERTVAALAMNSEIGVLYLPDDPTRSMIYPIPGDEFFER